MFHCNKPQQARLILAEYYKILAGTVRPKFQVLKDEGLFDAKVTDSRAILSSCDLCERHCGVDRLSGQLGYCGVTSQPEVSSAFAHTGEEHFLVPSFTIFFMGCNFKCQFCQNYEISQFHSADHRVDSQALARLIERGAKGGCKNVNFVGGEPTPNLPFVFEALSHVNADIPTVWNSNFYFSEASQSILKDSIDIYLSDWKYGPGDCADRLSKVPNYWNICQRNHDFAYSEYQSNGAALVIRHLIMPNHVECCSKPIIDYLAENYGENVIVNCMAQYYPEYHAVDIEEIARKPTREEVEAVWDYAEEKGIVYLGRPSRLKTLL